ncbi:MAG: hypothetical protein MJ222_02560 [Bacilli bacterium]|nr:hypothetical protein [Bacilli bacterium]
MAYEFINKSETRTKLLRYCESNIIKLQKNLSEYFTFQFSLIGSGSTRLLMVNGNDNHIDFDYNLVLKRYDPNLLKQPSKIRELFMKEIQKVFGSQKDLKKANSTSVISTYLGNLYGYKFSIDFAIMYEDKNGAYQKLIFDKNSNKFIWNIVPKSNHFMDKFLKARQLAGMLELKEIYKDKKNKYINDQNKKSFAILLETVNEILDKYE